MSTQRVEDVRPAGVFVPKLPTDTTKYSLASDERLPTPHEVRKWRTTYNAVPGTHTIDDQITLDSTRHALPPECQTFGNRGTDSDHVPNLFADSKVGPATQFVAETKEAIYASRHREPLGVVATRGHVFPSECRDPNFSFGLPTVYSEPAKNLLYPIELPPEKPEVHEKYLRTHNAYEAAEQRSRGYQWPQGVDPKAYRFGQAERRPYEESRFCLKPETDPSVVVPRIVKKEVEERNALAGGDCRAKPTGLTIPYDDKHVYGLPGKGLDEWGALDCVHGAYSWEEQQPGDDLGRSTRPGYRNVTSETRAFGVPTVRYDLREPTLKSITDTQNYGSEPGAFNLTHPDVFACQGVQDAQFAKPRSEADIRALFARIGYEVEESVFQKIFARAKELTLTARGEVSIQEYREALNQYLGAKEENLLPSWWN